MGRIGRGLLVFVGVGRKDTQDDADYIVGKIQQLRVFENKDGKMNRSVLDVDGEVLLVSQFTLYGDWRKGRVRRSKPRHLRRRREQSMSR